MVVVQADLPVTTSQKVDKNTNLPANTLGMAVENATALLDQFCAENIAVEVTHRSKRRLYGLAGLAPLRDAVAPPHRPQPGRGRPPDDRGRGHGVARAPAGRRPVDAPRAAALDTSDLEAALAFADETVRRTRRSLETLRAAVPASAIESKEARPIATIF